VKNKEMDAKQLYFDLENEKPDLVSFRWDKRFIDENLRPVEMYERYKKDFKYLKNNDS
jgi:hypothetical protein